ncbi:hypothetical protein GCM10009077_37680 [Roseibium denhamense]|uniref:Uncharacterized protein n=1 Tax=Roseibium denhamense TaxID=76305 RepID=A0ABY1PA81_9HYPH|nr:hypothetical protein SAMN06265374_3184 [Roseibium denhamense]
MASLEATASAVCGIVVSEDIAHAVVVDRTNGMGGCASAVRGLALKRDRTGLKPIQTGDLAAQIATSQCFLLRLADHMPMTSGRKP